MKSERAQRLFSELIDANWEIKEHRENNTKSPTFLSDYLELETKYNQIREDLIEEMGQEEYDNFMSMGRKMFAPKES